MKQKQLQIVVGSTNPVKLKAAENAVRALHPDAEIHCQAMKAPSGVAEQPMTDADTRQGAINRVEWCKANADADYYLAMEGGVDNFPQGPATFAYVVIATKKRLCVGRSAHLPLPPKVYAALKAGEELGDVMDSLFNTVNVKQAGGAIGLLTQGHATRESIYHSALLLASAPLRYPELY
ncbi:MULTISPECIES: inosine/xanthosine triphosphatase [Shewanella]|uniref:Probable inosine/xanthosine triphosphatase n=2 Tax=Unclassified Bacteria TaxID=49928 RepID=A0AAU6VRF8_UNCXX|nr:MULTISPECIES: inosine/xanthosine triphosphatase [Shewanella]MDE0567646.1 inosine/xanthosine triphosphatase [Shewanella sp. K8]OHY52710.1 inosine/xanthosine triphosphatase [Shewanella algae]TVP06040.1 xanthosine triphosphate pyrophosphatase [Shewanella algae]TWU68785.1 xanthosine triphosphate pyrophosphatase [Shewanella algae]BCV39654.1 non-canonical purine NTP phosphatase [Shewanella algae]